MEYMKRLVKKAEEQWEKDWQEMNAETGEESTVESIHRPDLVSDMAVDFINRQIKALQDGLNRDRKAGCATDLEITYNELLYNLIIQRRHVEALNAHRAAFDRHYRALLAQKQTMLVED